MKAEIRVSNDVHLESRPLEDSPARRISHCVLFDSFLALMSFSPSFRKLDSARSIDNLEMAQRQELDLIRYRSAKRVWLRV